MLNNVGVSVILIALAVISFFSTIIFLVIRAFVHYFSPGKQSQIDMPEFYRRTSNVIFISLAVILLSWLYGYASKGDHFLLNQILFNNGNSIEERASDHITPDGKYIADNGQTYSHYIIIEKTDVRINNTHISNSSDIISEIAQISRENTVLLIDDYAASSVYQTIRSTLNELGIRFEEERR